MRFVVLRKVPYKLPGTKRIVWGVIVGLGEHDELLASCPTYADIVRSQLDAPGDADA